METVFLTPRTEIKASYVRVWAETPTGVQEASIARVEAYGRRYDLIENIRPGESYMWDVGRGVVVRVVFEGL